MNRKLMYPLVIASLLSAAGCSPIPKATTPDQTPQIKLQSAQHWGVIADHLADQIIASSQLDSEAIYVGNSPTASNFETVFIKQISSALVIGGARVMTTGSVRLSLEVDVDLVSHANDRDKGTNFAETAAAGYIWAVAKYTPPAHTWSAASAIGYSIVPLAIANDISKVFPSRTNTEVVVTTRIMDGDLIRFSETHSYYIADMAQHQYRGAPAPPESSIVKMTRHESPGGQQ